MKRILKVQRPPKCAACYKYLWCMLSFDESFLCLGAFSGVEDNIQRFSEWYKKNKN